MRKLRPFTTFFEKPETLVILFVLVAVFLRVYRLNDFPPALNWDETFDGFDALRVVTTPSHPIFFDGDVGREPLEIYLQAFGILLWGAKDWVLRIVPALVGIATVPIVYRLVLTLYAGEARAKMIGALAAGMLAVSFWHIDLSRISIRAITVPFLSATTVWLYWRAFRSRRFFDYALSGAALGLTLYTYLPARLLPIVFVGFVIATGLLSMVRVSRFRSIDLRHAILGLGVMLAAMLIVFAPLGIYFLSRPGAFFLRASYISIFSGDAQGLSSLFYNIVATIRMFIDRGDLEQARNLPGQPALDLLTTVGFWVGLTIAFTRMRSRPAYLLLLLWLGLNLVATIFSVEVPHFYRTSGGLPPALVLAADGWMWIWQRTVPKTSPVAMAVALVVFGGTLSFNSYFNLWMPSNPTYGAFDGPRRSILERAIELSSTTDVILPFSLYGTPNAKFYLATRFTTAKSMQAMLAAQSAVWMITGGLERTVVILQKDGSVLVPQPLDDEKLARLGKLMSEAQPLTNQFGQSVASELRINNAAEFLSPLAPTHSVGAIFGRQIKLLGYDLDPPTVAPGDKVRVTYYWDSLADQEFDYWVASVLQDSSGEAFGKRLSEPASTMSPTSLWRNGETALDSFEFQVPTSAHPGKYRFEVALISPTSPNQPIPISASDDRIVLAPFTVARETVNPSSIRYPLSIKLGTPAIITLLGYDLVRATARRGEPFGVTFYWRAEQAIPTNYSIFLHLVDADGKIVGQQDGPPQNGNAPTSWWQPNDLIPDRHEIFIPTGLVQGRFTLEFGVYDSANGLRLPVSDLAAGRIIGDFISFPLEINDH